MVRRCVQGGRIDSVSLDVFDSGICVFVCVYVYVGSHARPLHEKKYTLQIQKTGKLLIFIFSPSESVNF